MSERVWLSNCIYSAIIEHCEELELKGAYSGNGHHLAQKLSEMSVKAIKDRYDVIMIDKNERPQQDPCFKWISDHPEAAEEYKGKHVAIDPQKGVIDSDASLFDLCKRLDKLDPEKERFLLHSY